MIKRISPPIGRVWSDDDLVALVQLLIHVKRSGGNFFDLPSVKSLDPDLVEFLKEFYDDNGIDKTVYIYPDDKQPVASWRITPGRNGLGVWSNVQRV